MSLSHSILGFLTYGSSSGYDLAKLFDSTVRFFWHAQASQVYLELGKLEKKELVSSELIMQMDRPNKKVYTITEAGRKEFLNWLCSEPTSCKGTKDPFLLKVFFAGNQSPEESLKSFRQFMTDCEKCTASMGGVPDMLEGYSQQIDPYQILFWTFTADYGQSYMRFCMDWAQRCIDELEGIIGKNIDNTQKNTKENGGQQ